MFGIFIVYLLFQCTSIHVWSEPTLDEQNSQNKLNPLNENSNSAVNKEHDKRTIFGSQNYGWAKHVGLHPSGFRYVIGYGPVDLKYVPVLRPPIKLVSHQFIHDHRPRWPIKLLRPSLSIRPSHDHHGWKPVQPVVKPVVVNPVITLRPVAPILRPVVPIVKPATPIVKPIVPIIKPVVPISVQDNQWPNKSWQHDEWQQKPVVAKPVVTFTPEQLVPVRPIVKPLPPPQFIPVNQVVPIQSAPVVPVQQAPPLVVSDPWVPLVKPAYPLAPQHQFINIQKPNLQILPLGGTYPSPVLHQGPTGTGIILQKPQLIPSNPTTLLQFHGTQHILPANGFINIPKLAPVQPQYAPQFTQTLVPSSPSFVHQSTYPYLNVEQQLPQVSQYPQFIQQNHDVTQFQQLPQNTVTHFQQSPQQNQVTQFQQLPQQQFTQFQQQTQTQGQQIVDEQYQPPLAHGRLPLEGENLGQQEQNHLFTPSTNQGQDSELQQEQFQGSNFIQPGQSDVQTPLYLPPHPNFNPQVESFQGFNSQSFNDFRPSPSLEPPYNNFSFNRREDVDEEVLDENTQNEQNSDN